MTDDESGGLAIGVAADGAGPLEPVLEPVVAGASNGAETIGDPAGVSDPTSHDAVGHIGPIASPVAAAISACPYFVDAEGPWRRAQPGRTHRCAAQMPAASIPALKQKRVCLTQEHATCEFFVSASRARQDALVSAHIHPEQLAASKFQALSQSLPVAIDRAATEPGVRPETRGRFVAFGVIGALVIVAILLFGTFLLPRNAPGTFVAVLPSASMTPAPPTALAPSGSIALPSPSTPGVTPSTSPAPSPAPSTTPSAPATATPLPTPTPQPTVHKYQVQPGDTLQKIAQRFGTTVKALMAANDLADPAAIRVGENLIIP